MDEATARQAAVEGLPDSRAGLTARTRAEGAFAAPDGPRDGGAATTWLAAVTAVGLLSAPGRTMGAGDGDRNRDHGVPAARDGPRRSRPQARRPEPRAQGAGANAGTGARPAQRKRHADPAVEASASSAARSSRRTATGGSSPSARGAPTRTSGATRPRADGSRPGTLRGAGPGRGRSACLQASRRAPDHPRAPGGREPAAAGRDLERQAPELRRTGRPTGRPGTGNPTPAASEVSSNRPGHSSSYAGSGLGRTGRRRFRARTQRSVRGPSDWGPRRGPETERGRAVPEGR